MIKEALELSAIINLVTQGKNIDDKHDDDDSTEDRKRISYTDVIVTILMNLE